MQCSQRLAARDRRRATLASERRRARAGGRGARGRRPSSPSPRRCTRALGREEVDVVLLHHKLAPAAGDGAGARPRRGFPTSRSLLVVEDDAPDLLRAAIQAGAPRRACAAVHRRRAAHGSLTSAAEWGPQSAAAGPASRGDGRRRRGGVQQIAVAGGKGGVGATTVAIRLALAAAAEAPKPACLFRRSRSAGRRRARLLRPAAPAQRHRPRGRGAAELSGARGSGGAVRARVGLRILLAPEEGEHGGGRSASGPGARTVWGRSSSPTRWW